MNRRENVEKIAHFYTKYLEEKTDYNLRQFEFVSKGYCEEIIKEACMLARKRHREKQSNSNV